MPFRYSSNRRGHKNQHLQVHGWILKTGCTYFIYHNTMYLLNWTTMTPVKHCDVPCKSRSYCDNFSWWILQNGKCSFYWSNTCEMKEIGAVLRSCCTCFATKKKRIIILNTAEKLSGKNIEKKNEFKLARKVLFYSFVLKNTKYFDFFPY